MGAQGFDAQRAEIRGKIATAEAELAAVDERLGALALDVTLGAASQRDLDAATAEHARLSGSLSGWRGALVEIDRREAAQREQAAADERRRDEARLSDLEAVRRKVGAKVVKLARDLAAACREGSEAEREAHLIGRRLGADTTSRWSSLAWRLVVARLYGILPEAPKGFSGSADEYIAEAEGGMTDGA